MTTAGYVGQTETTVKILLGTVYLPLSFIHSSPKGWRASSPYELFLTERDSDLVVFFPKPPTGRLRAGVEELRWDSGEEGVGKGGLI